MTISYKAVRWSSVFPSLITMETMSHSRWSADIPGCDPDMQHPERGKPRSGLSFSFELRAEQEVRV